MTSARGRRFVKIALLGALFGVVSLIGFLHLAFTFQWLTLKRSEGEELTWLDQVFDALGYGVLFVFYVIGVLLAVRIELVIRKERDLEAGEDAARDTH